MCAIHPKRLQKLCHNVSLSAFGTIFAPHLVERFAQREKTAGTPAQ